MNNVQVLDCTLRDGGYVNNWGFSVDQSTNIINSLIESNIEFIECGYLDFEQEKNTNTTRYNSIENFDNLYSMLSDGKEDKKMFLMIDYKSGIDLSLIPNKAETNLDGLRIAFHKKYKDEVCTFSKQLIEKGYDVCVQPMITSSYSDGDLIKLINEVNTIKPFAFYIVDSFGTMDNQNISELFNFVNSKLDETINFGFHSHNNKQLAFSNSVKFIEMAKDRKIMIDASIYGMGRGAGNLNSEIITDYVNKQHVSKYNLYPILNVIDSILKNIKKESEWGYSIEYFLSASNGCHPNYSSYLMKRNTLKVESLAEILNQIPADQKLSFNKELAEKLYFDYLTKDNSELEMDTIFKDQEIMLIASGTSVTESARRIIEYRNLNKDVLVIALNHIPEIGINADFYMFSNQKRYETYKNLLQSNQTIITSNISGKAKFTISMSKIINSQTSVSDNVAAIALQYLINTGVKKVTLAGLDGYSLSENAYSYNEIDKVTDNAALLKLNEELRTYLETIKNKIDIRFITASQFDKLFRKRVLGVIPARYKSSRFPGKPLAKILDVPMIKRTFDRASQSELLDYLVVATDDDKIEDYCNSVDIPVIRTSEDCLTGTDRVAEVAKNLDYDFYVNIQGDEPLISVEAIDAVIHQFNVYGTSYPVYNLYKEIEDLSEFESNTVIKVLVNEENELVYMSRYPVPFNKSGLELKPKKQVCVYGFTPGGLIQFSQKDKTINEKYEDIEILRFIDSNQKVKMAQVYNETIAVDRPEDIIKVENYINETLIIK